MAKLNLQTRLYIGLIVLLALIVSLTSYHFAGNQPVHLKDIALLIILATLAEGYSFNLGRQYTVSAHPVVHTAIIFLLPPPAVVLVCSISITIEQIACDYIWYKKVFNISHHIIISTVAAILFGILGKGATISDVDHHPEFFLLAPLVMVIYYLLDVAIIDLVIALSTGTSFVKLWFLVNRQVFLFDISSASIGLVLAVVWLQSPVFGFLLLLPVVVNRYAVKSLKQLEAETKQAIIAITELVEARDPYTFGHSLRVGEYCLKISEELGLEREEIDQIALAGRVHDLGKIGVSDAVLLKPGKLNEVEWIEMKKHASTGAEILENFSFYKEGVKYVLHHHEAWDGSGYPTGISKDEIPLGARVIAVADSFDAMTTDRPYRKGMPVEKAISILIQNRDKQWDARVVDAFLRYVRTKYPLASNPPVDQVQKLPEASLIS